LPTLLGWGRETAEEEDGFGLLVADEEEEGVICFEGGGIRLDG
jgi:hypothetical protein